MKLVATDGVSTPRFALPMAGGTDEVEGLYLRRFGVPFDALATDGRDASCWYRLHQSLGAILHRGISVRDAQKDSVNLV